MRERRTGSVIVTGGVSGLGEATARRLATAWEHVVVIDLPRDGAQATVDAFGAVFAPGDVTSEEEVRSAVELAASLAPLRAVVHCAGRGGALRILDREGAPGSLEHFAEVVRVNLVGSFNVLRLAAQSMATNDLEDGDRGAIVLTASAAAFEGQIGQIPYASSKAGVNGMTIVAARDLAGRAIRVNTIAPGIFGTPMLSGLKAEVRESLEESVPHPARLGEPDEFAALAEHMINNRYLNGATVRLDGAIRMAPR